MSFPTRSPTPRHLDCVDLCCKLTERGIRLCSKQVAGVADRDDRSWRAHSRDGVLVGKVEARLFASRCPEPVERLLLHGDGLAGQVIEQRPYRSANMCFGSTIIAVVHASQKCVPRLPARWLSTVRSSLFETCPLAQPN